MSSRADYSGGSDSRQQSVYYVRTVEGRRERTTTRWGRIRNRQGDLWRELGKDRIWAGLSDTAATSSTCCLWKRVGTDRVYLQD